MACCGFLALGILHDVTSWEWLWLNTIVVVNSLSCKGLRVKGFLLLRVFVLLVYNKLFCWWCWCGVVGVCGRGFVCGPFGGGYTGFLTVVGVIIRVVVNGG